ncbi:MAG: TonB-dependent receptor plug domain-containing protein [Saprospiraceae bacterium]|nr:TonB-dependent receptor plug domain-containing protein [Saprospiraceae bacterium]
MKWNQFLLLFSFGILLCACGTSKDAQDNLTEEGILQTFNEENSGNSIVYTNEDEKIGNHDVQTSLDYNEKTSDVLYTALVDRLRKIGGLTISGTGDNVSVLVRGMSSIKFSNQPIYVIDGFNVGDNYARANNAVDVNQIKSIRVLKGPAQTALYGEEGKNGVIIIKTFNGSKKK